MILQARLLTCAFFLPAVLPVQTAAEIEPGLENESDIPTRRFQLFSPAQGLPAVVPFRAALTAPLAPGEPEEGAVVEKVTKGWAAERAGIRPGDLLLSWSCANGNSGPLRSPFELGQLEIEQAPRSAVTLRGTREGGKQEWTLPPGRWRLKARPTLSEALFSLYEQGRNRLATGDLAAGAEQWRTAVDAADPLRAAWLQAHLARELADAGRWLEADSALEEAVEWLEESQPAAAAQLLRDWDWIETLLRHNSLDRAEVSLRRSLTMDPEESLATAWDLSSLGMIERERLDYTAAEEHLQKANVIQEKLAPGNVAPAWIILQELAKVAYRRNNPATEEEFLLKALEILERLAPESLETSAILSELGRNAIELGDLPTGEERLQRALTMVERLSPDDPELASILVYIGYMNWLRGNLVIAEEHLRRALALSEELEPDSYHVALILNRLSFVAEERGDLAATWEHRRRALQVLGKLAQNSNISYSGAYYLIYLALYEKSKGNLAKADGYLHRVLEWPEGYIAGDAYFLLANIAIEGGNLARAEIFQGRALAMMEKQFSGSVWVSDILASLGTIAYRRGNLPKAEDLFRRALAIREKMAPDSIRVGLSLNDLGRVYRRAGHLAMAAEHFCRATKVFDQQRTKLGGTTERRAAFGGRVAEYYQDCVASLVDLGRPKEAFRALERGRARSFLDLLAERDMRLVELPPELARDRKQTDADYDRTQAALARLSPARDGTEIDRLLVRLREIQARQEEITARIRLASPRTAALHNPQPLDLAGARVALDPGTVLLEYAVGPERTWLFVVQPSGTTGSGLSVFRVSTGEKALREEVERFRQLLGRPRSDRATLQARARRLYDLLVRPAERQITGAGRLLFSPDGPLHTLPFAALMRGNRYLVEWKPIHSVLSATVYAEIKRSRPARFDPAEEGLVAFGDPVYPSTAGVPTDPEVREAVRRGLALKPLPSSRREVESIAALYHQAHAYLGRDATEERAKSIGPESRLIHFASHGLLDEHFPLNSALALTLPEHQAEGQENGLLQAWEIFESMRLDADLVTLSACDTALGKEMGGEGLIGLTRAFQYAGARSVLASLWGVADVSTARFMKRFYSHLHDGKTKDEALRAAQIDQIRAKPGSSHPFHWAAFELFGDWR